MAIRINEQHLGTDATAEEAQEMVRLLRERGYHVEYGDDDNANAIPDAVWLEIACNRLRFPSG
jgi:hypothetical protein